ncbi:MAG: Fatty acid metabolism regulator protein [Syntrophomonadaceae bacterium]|nr:Fatty acid metabolism regulator protein [Bacillota bacterium]
MSKNSHKGFASRREEIVFRATELFARFGYKKTTVAAIAGALGLVKGALYAYFEDKEDIYLACFEKQIDRLRREAVRFQEPNLTAQENLKRLYETAKGLLAESPFLIKAMKGDRPSDSQLFKAQVELYELEAARMVDGILRQGKANGAMQIDDTGLTALVLVRLFYYLLKGRYKVDEGWTDWEKASAELLRLIIRGLAAPAVLSARRHSPDWWLGKPK